MESATGDQRVGVDTRQRGWFWHWNGIVTQYAPLIGLKGIGLLNSYTVWTDRREESPHRGYAFPSQQAEADFYGEERAELITINKILVALGLIEIRKEMILRTDERGRKWRVPHNLYRVRDRPDGVTLRATDVLCVADLAKRDDAVFRHVRRVFSSRFKPIDRDNVWHSILAELADHPLWQELQERTREIEERASARTRAGHRRRAADNTTLSSSRETSGHSGGDGSLSTTEHHGIDTGRGQTVVASTNNGFHPNESAVGAGNTGLRTDVGSSNSGSTRDRVTSAAASNNGQNSTVELTNTTYDQEIHTTTTTTNAGEQGAGGGRDDTRSLPTMAVPFPVLGDQNPTQHRESRSARPSPPSGVKTDDQTTSRARGTDKRKSVHGGTGDSSPRSSLRAVERVNEPEREDALGRDVDDRDADANGYGARPGRGAEVGIGSSTGTGIDDGGRNRSSDAAGTRLVLAGDDTPEQGIDPGEVPDDGQRLQPGGPTARGDDGERGLAGANTPAGTGGASGPVVDPSPLVVSVFEAANNRRSTPLERVLLGELERDADPPARAAGATGAEWLAEAMREAVASGSSFVAPKRIREIVNRWAGDGKPGGAELQLSTQQTTAVPPDAASPMRKKDDAGRSEDVDIEAVRLPGGVRGASVWAAVLDDLSRLLDPEAFDRLLADSVITRYWRGTVEVRVASNAAAGKLSAEYRGMIERQINARLKRPVAVSFHATPVEMNGDVAAAMETTTHDRSDEASSHTIVVSAADVDLGRQLWHAILDDLASDTSPDDLERLEVVVPLGQDATGTMVLGVSSPVARRLIDGRYKSRIERSLSGLLGSPVAIRTIADDAWTVRG